jgi:hypothetical protein
MSNNDLVPTLRAQRHPSPISRTLLAPFTQALTLALLLLSIQPLTAVAQSAPVAAAASATAAPAASTPTKKMQHKHAASLAVGAAISPAGELWITGLEAGELFVKSSADLGKTWRAPLWPATGDDSIVADGDSCPSLAFGPQGQVVIAYAKPLAKPYTGDIRLLRSTDGGATFAPPITVHADRQVITHRFQSMAFDASGFLHVVWIDKRDGELAWAQARADAASAKAPASAAPAKSAERDAERDAYRGAAIYRAVSTDGGATFGADQKLADHSCECCRIALAPTPDGHVAAVWRHVFAPNERDHAFAILGGDAVDSPARATLDHWQIDACPHHGPGLAAATGGGWHLVWFGVRDGQAAVRYGRLDAAGNAAGEVRSLPDERAEHADVAAAGDRVAIVWRSFDGQNTRLRAWLSADGGQHFRLNELGATAGDSDQPHLLQRDGAFYSVWRTATGVQIDALHP